MHLLRLRKVIGGHTARKPRGLLTWEARSLSMTLTITALFRNIEWHML